MLVNAAPKNGGMPVPLVALSAPLLLFVKPSEVLGWWSRHPAWESQGSSARNVLLSTCIKLHHAGSVLNCLWGVGGVQGGVRRGPRASPKPRSEELTTLLPRI